MKTTTAMTMPAIAPPERVVWILFMGAIAGSSKGWKPERNLSL